MPQDYRRVPRLAYIDSDPVFTQVKLRLPRGQKKFSRRFKAHDINFSFGESLSESTAATESRWLPTRQPIVLSEWQPSRARRNVFTTVMNWTSYKPLKFGKQSYGQKDEEFKRFLELPGKVTPILEVALGKTQHANWQTQSDNLPPVARE